MAHTVIRTDLLSGTLQAADLVSCRVYDDSDEFIDVDNGVIVELQEYEDGEREVIKAVLASADSKLTDCAIIATPEVLYDERLKNLSDFYNEAGTICRGYLPRSRNMFSVTAEGFVDETVPAKGDSVGIGTDGKIDASGSGLGICVAVEPLTRYTYYVIKLDDVEV